MRILDLGAHDGFVSDWIVRQLRANGVTDIHCDGVEANSTGVARFNERMERLGVTGVCHRGLAEDAERLCEIGSYDAVVAFEVIEHVPDVDEFLRVCEAMCRPGGRVYLSTPDGCFGDGNNPHHLRVYRSIDLFELCRRRGEVVDMTVGFDTVTVIAYEPYVGRPPREELTIYCGPGWEKWHPMDIESKGLGGSETAAIRLAEAMADKYNVTVYGECDYCAYKQVVFKPHHTFDPMDYRDGFICSRIPAVFDVHINAGRKLLWMHDTDYGPSINEARAEKIDAVMVLSEWHRDHVAELYPFLEDKLVVTGNAIEPSYFDVSTPTEVRPPTALYSSSPDRGLDLLLDLWPEVREAIPDAELHFCYSSVYDKVAEQNSQIGAFRNKVRTLSDQPGVVNLGSLTQPQLAAKMSEVAVWLAPSYNTVHDAPFYETYCIGAQEAAAAGACLVVSDWGALPERTELAVNSIRIPEFNKDQWVRAIVNGMTQVTYQRSLAALNLTWKVRAQEFDKVIVYGLPTPAR